MGELISPLDHDVERGFQDSVLRALRRQLAAVVQERRVHLARGRVTGPLRAGLRRHRGALDRRQRARVVGRGVRSRGAARGRRLRYTVDGVAPSVRRARRVPTSVPTWPNASADHRRRGGRDGDGGDPAEGAVRRVRGRAGGGCRRDAVLIQRPLLRCRWCGLHHRLGAPAGRGSRSWSRFAPGWSRA